MKKIKKIKEAAAFLRDAGLLFEFNRTILHPLGLALETVIEDDGSETFGKIWDCRDDPEGIIYNDECYESGAKKLECYMQEHGKKIWKSRFESLDYIVQKKHIVTNVEDGKE